MECRTPLAPGVACDAHPRAKPLDLANAQQRNRAVDAVWGPPHLRKRQLAKAGGAGGGMGGLFEGCGEGCSGVGDGLSGEAAIAVLVIMIAAFAAIAVYYVIKWIAYQVRAWRERPRPVGVRWKPHRGHHVLRATISAAQETVAPLSYEACAAWGVVLTNKRAVGGKVVLRDGGTGGLSLTLDDGRVLEVPAGRVRVVGTGTDLDANPAYLKTIDPGYSSVEPHPVVPFDTAHEIRFAVGDQVEIIGGLVEQFDPDGKGGYRDMPATRWTLDGVCTLVRAAR